VSVQQPACRSENPPKIPGFAGLIVFGDSKREALAELESALSGWIEISLRRGDGLPALHGELAKTR